MNSLWAIFLPSSATVGCGGGRGVLQYGTRSLRPSPTDPTALTPAKFSKLCGLMPAFSKINAAWEKFKRSKC